MVELEVDRGVLGRRECLWLLIATSGSTGFIDKKLLSSVEEEKRRAWFVPYRMRDCVKKCASWSTDSVCTNRQLPQLRMPST